MRARRIILTDEPWTKTFTKNMFSQQLFCVNMELSSLGLQIGAVFFSHTEQRLAIQSSHQSNPLIMTYGPAMAIGGKKLAPFNTFR